MVVAVVGLVGGFVLMVLPSQSIVMGSSSAGWVVEVVLDVVD